MFAMLSIIMCIGFAIWSAFSPSVGLAVWIGTMWSVCSLLYLQHRFTRPSAQAAQRILLGDNNPGSLSDEEVRTFRRYHSWFVFPLVAVQLASAVTVLRVAGLISGIAALCLGYFFVAALGVSAFFVFGPLTVTLHPLSWINPEASKGTPYAVQQQAIVGRLLDLTRDREGERRKVWASKEAQQLVNKRGAGQITHSQFEAAKARLDEFTANNEQPQRKAVSTSAAVDNVLATQWNEILKSPDLSSDIQAAIREVFIPLRIYPHRFIENSAFLECEGRNYLLPPGSPKPRPTSSLARCPYRAHWPAGQPAWFIAAFPDVSHWANKTVAKAQFDHDPTAIMLLDNEHEKLQRFLESEGISLDDENAVRHFLEDASGKTSAKYGRLMAEWYQESTGRILETAVP